MKFNCELSKYAHIRSDSTFLFYGVYSDINNIFLYNFDTYEISCTLLPAKHSTKF